MKNPLCLPSPVELGRANCNALPMREFTPEVEGYSWEDYYTECKTKYPIRYFLNEKLWFWLKYRCWGRVSDAIYWVKSYLLPSKRYHFLDLRQPKGSWNEYQFGWIDAVNQVPYACFNILCNFVEKELPHSYCQQEFTEEELNDPCSGEACKRQQADQNEIKAIYHWWKITHPAAQKSYSETLTAWSNTRGSKDPLTEKLWEQLKQLEDKLEQDETDYLIRLIKIRGRLWT